MARTIADFNAEYAYKRWRKEETETAKPQKGSVFLSTMFYLVLIGLVLFVYFYSSSGSLNKRLGYSLNNVISRSMEPVYPIGALVVSKAVDPGEPLAAGLDDGDDIVFALEDATVIVHRIIEIPEGTSDEGLRLFRTQGVNNPDPDPWVIPEEYIVGRVVWSMAGAGDVLAVIAENNMWIIAALVGLFLLVTLLRFVLKPSSGKKGATPKEKEQPKAANKKPKNASKHKSAIGFAAGPAACI